MNGYLVTMVFIGAVGVLGMTAPFENKPKWLGKAALAWALFWVGPALVVIWINGVFG